MNLTTDVGSETAALKSAQESYKSNIESVSATVESLKGCWVEFAKKFAEESSVFARDQDWWRHLIKWADVMDRADCSLPLCQKTSDRFKELITHMEQLPALLSLFPTICFDMYGNMISGSIAEVGVNNAMLRSVGDKLKGWMDSCPIWSAEDYSATPKAKRGEILYRANGTQDTYFDDPNSVNVPNENDVQVGISRFDFGNKPSWRTATKLRVGDSHNANRVWEKRNDQVDFYDAKSSWIEVPSKLRDRIQFGTTTADDEGGQNPMRIKQVVTPGMDDLKDVPYSQLDNGHYGSTWEVKFPKAFTSENVTVKAWFMDFNVKCGKTFIGHKVTVSDVSKEKFRVLAEVAGALDYSRIAYMAYENDHADGIHTETYHLDVPYLQQVMNQNHNWKPVYIDFPQGKFRRRPAVANMMSMFWINGHWNYRVDYSYAASRDGIIIQGRSWGDTILCDLRYEIIALTVD